MLTLFTLPKAFEGHTGIIQRNAIQSWLRVPQVSRVILLGSDAGTADYAAEFGLDHVPVVARTEAGVPLFNDVIEQGQRTASTPFLCYTNCDIILMSDFGLAFDRVRTALPRFLMTSSRCNLDIDQELDFGADWEACLRRDAQARGRYATYSWIDYFVYRNGLLAEIPPFIIGRGCYDQWLLFHARAQGAELVDVTPAVLAVHQNHDYGHAAAAANMAHPDWEYNKELSFFNRLDMRDATYLLRDDQVRPARSAAYLRRRLYSYPKFLIPAARPLRALYLVWRNRIKRF